MSGRIAFLLSGSGSTLRNLLAEIDAGRVAGEVVVVISDRPRVGGLDIAREAGIDAVVVARKEHKGFEVYSEAIAEALAPYDADLVVSGGFLTLFKVPASLGLLPGRVTYVIDKQGVVQHAFNSQMNPLKHIEESLDVLKRLG